MNKKESDKMLRDLITRSFPNGLPKPNDLKANQARAKSSVLFLKAMGYRLVNVDEQTRTAQFSLFIGNPIGKKGLEIRWECAVDFLGSSTRKELVESLLTYVTATYTKAVLDAEENSLLDN